MGNEDEWAWATEAVDFEGMGDLVPRGKEGDKLGDELDRWAMRMSGLGLQRRAWATEAVDVEGMEDPTLEGMEDPAAGEAVRRGKEGDKLGDEEEETDA